jgi:hypothetical protein
VSSADFETKYKEYEILIRHLQEVIVDSKSRVLQEPPDPLFFNNLNFFTKAFLISLCTNLEAFLQDIAFAYVSLVQQRLASAKVPNNVIRWALSKDLKKDELKFENFSFSTNKKEIADELSGNPGKTIVLFRHIGIDLQASEDFKAYKDIVGAMVEKRNNIIHHNDSAADISMADLLTYADQFLLYMKAIRDRVLSSCVLA